MDKSLQEGQLSARPVTRRLFLSLFSAAVVGTALSACASPSAPATATAKPAGTTAAAATAAPATAAAATKPPATAAPTQAPAKLDYPAGKPVTMLIGANPGGGMDVACRTLQPYLEKEMGTTLVPTNKPAAGGQASLSEGTKAKPDGYTLFMISPPTHTAIWLDPRRQPDFKRTQIFPIANHVWDPGALMVRNDAPWKSVTELVKEAKEKPGTIVATMSAKNGDDHFMTLDIMSKTGADFNVVNNDGNAPAVTQFVGGHAHVMVANESECIPLVKRGDGKILAIAHPQRTKYSPDVPTFKELGLDVVSYSMRGYAAQAAVPKPILDFLVAAFKKALSNPELVDKMEKMSYPVSYLGPEDYLAQIKKEDEKVTRLAKEFKIFDAIPQE